MRRYGRKTKEILTMAQSSPIRNPEKDFLLTPANSVFAFIDYQPEQFYGVHSKDRDDLMMNIVTLAKIAHDFDMPTVLSTVGVRAGVNQATVPELREALLDVREIDRSTLNAWEDEDFVAAVKQTGRKKLVIAGLWTEVCVAFPTLDALESGYDVYPVIDAIGGITKETHEAAIQRMIQSGAQPITTLALACELQRDWARNQGKVLRNLLQGYFLEMRSRSQHEPGFRRDAFAGPSAMHS
jgi:nicotinamidase-related amidase